MPFIFHCPRTFVSFELILLILPRMQNRRYLTSFFSLFLPPLLADYSLQQSFKTLSWLTTNFTVNIQPLFLREKTRKIDSDRRGRISEFCRCRGNSKGTKILRWRFTVVLECTIQINCAVIAVPPFEYRFHLNVNSSEKFSKYPRDLITRTSLEHQCPSIFSHFFKKEFHVFV